MKEIEENKLMFETNIFYVEELDKTFINIQVETDYVVTEKTWSFFGLLEPLEIEEKEHRLLRKALSRHIKTVKKYLTRNYLKD